MITKTYYGKLDCYSVGIEETIGNEIFKNFFDFMSHLTASNVATLVAWNSGSSVASASFNQRGFWDQNNPYGVAANAVWRFPTSSTRPFEWYLYTQIVSGSAATQFSFVNPITGYGSSTTNLANNSSTRAIIIQAAVCSSGTSFFNPWNGSGVADGASNAGNPRWVPGGTNRTMYILPRSNDNGGTAVHIAQKSNATSIAGWSASSTRVRYHFICDGDSLVALVSDDTNARSTYSFNYVGPFELRNDLSTSGICSSSFGLTMFNVLTSPLANTVVYGTTYGDTGGSTVAQNGGISVPIGGTDASQAGSGSKGAVLATISSLTDITYQPSMYTTLVDEFPILIAGNEAPSFGLLGTFNTGLVRCLGAGAAVHDVNLDNSRAVFGGSTIIGAATLKITIPWTGSLPPGLNQTRTGNTFTWTRNYG
jgi:hypothetical protein